MSGTGNQNSVISQVIDFTCCWSRLLVFWCRYDLHLFLSVGIRIFTLFLARRLRAIFFACCWIWGFCLFFLGQDMFLLLRGFLIGFLLTFSKISIFLLALGWIVRLITGLAVLLFLFLLWLLFLRIAWDAVFDLLFGVTCQIGYWLLTIFGWFFIRSKDLVILCWQLSQINFANVFH